MYDGILKRNSRHSWNKNVVCPSTCKHTARKDMTHVRTSRRLEVSKFLAEKPPPIWFIFRAVEKVRKARIWSRYTFWVQVVLQLSTPRYTNWQCSRNLFWGRTACSCVTWSCCPVPNLDWFHLSDCYFNFSHGRCCYDYIWVNTSHLALVAFALL